MSDWIDDPSCRPTALTTVGVGADQTINNNTANDPAKCVDPEECAGTGTKILYAVGGAALGFLGAWFLSDQQKKAAQERVASTARGTADGFRRGWSAPRAANPVSTRQALARQIVTDDQLRRVEQAGGEQERVAILEPSARRMMEVARFGSEQDIQLALSGVHERIRDTAAWSPFARAMAKTPGAGEVLKDAMRRRAMENDRGFYESLDQGPHAAWFKDHGYSYAGPNHGGWVHRETGETLYAPKTSRSFGR